MIQCYYHLNKYEQKILSEYAADYFINFYSVFSKIYDEFDYKDIYEQLIKLCPRDEAKLKLAVLSTIL